MLNEERVKHMVKLASFDENGGAEKIKIGSYYKKDYVKYNVIITLLWTTLGYVSLIAVLCLTYMKEALEELATFDMVLMIAGVIGGYLIVLLFYGAIAARHYKKKHQEAKQDVKKYVRNLDILERMYEREEA